jgi:hypothetical protein
MIVFSQQLSDTIVEAYAQLRKEFAVQPATLVLLIALVKIYAVLDRQPAQPAHFERALDLWKRTQARK